MRETCKNCIWVDICEIANKVRVTECPDYYDNEGNGEEEMVEREREEYYEAWLAYLKDDE